MGEVIKSKTPSLEVSLQDASSEALDILLNYNYSFLQRKKKTQNGILLQIQNLVILL